jgi:hypothetical protein
LRLTAAIGVVLCVPSCTATYVHEQKSEWIREPGQTRFIDLAGRYMIGDPPQARDINLEQYLALKAKCSARRKPLPTSGRDRRSYDFVLDSFDKTAATVALMSQHRSKAWRWEERYRLLRSPEVDRTLGIPRLVRERSRTIGGVRYGMRVSEVLALKGHDYRAVVHQDAGSADLVYDDVVVSVRGWSPDNRDGRVVCVAPPRPTGPQE